MQIILSSLRASLYVALGRGKWHLFVPQGELTLPRFQGSIVHPLLLEKRGVHAGGLTRGLLRLLLHFALLREIERC